MEILWLKYIEYCYVIFFLYKIWALATVEDGQNPMIIMTIDFKVCLIVENGQ